MTDVSSGVGGVGVSRRKGQSSDGTRLASQPKTSVQRAVCLTITRISRGDSLKCLCVSCSRRTELWNKKIYINKNLVACYKVDGRVGGSRRGPLTLQHPYLKGGGTLTIFFPSQSVSRSVIGNSLGPFSYILIIISQFSCEEEKFISDHYVVFSRPIKFSKFGNSTSFLFCWHCVKKCFFFILKWIIKKNWILSVFLTVWHNELMNDEFAPTKIFK